MIEMRRAQRSFGDGLIAEEVSDLREDWMRHADQVLADEQRLRSIAQFYRSGGRAGQTLLAGNRRGREALADVVQQLTLEGLRDKLDAMVPLVRKVMKQTRARILRGDTRGDGKLVSLFEPETEIIRKGKAGKPTEFGKMVKLQEAENQIVTDYEVYDRRPNDADLLIAAVETHHARFGRIPRLVAADAAFYQQRTRRRRKPRASNGSAFPIARPKVPSADASRKSAGSARARNGAPAVRAASAWSNADMVSTAVATKATPA